MPSSPRERCPGLSLLLELVTAAEFERVRQLDDVIAFARGLAVGVNVHDTCRSPPGTDERLVEVPWVLSRLRSGRVARHRLRLCRACLHRRARRGRPGELVGVDLVETEIPGFDTVVADARHCRSPMRRSTRCSSSRHSSTSERTMRCTASKQPPTRRAERRRSANCDKNSATVREPARDRAAGQPGDYGWFRQEDIRGWTRLFTGAGFFIEEQEAYELREEGWRAAPTFDPDGVEYGTRGPAASAVLCARAQPTATPTSRLSRRRAADGPPQAGTVVQAPTRLSRRASR